MSRTILLFLSCVVLCCVFTSVSARYLDCTKECYYNRYYTSCDCPSPKLPLRWGKRGVRVPFRWGKRSFDNYQPGSYGDSWYDSAPMDLSAYFEDIA